MTADLPDSNRLVITIGSESGAILEREPQDTATMPHERRIQALAGRCLPEKDLVPACRGKRAAIRAVGHGGDQALVPRQKRLQALALLEKAEQAAPGFRSVVRPLRLQGQQQRDVARPLMKPGG